MTIPNMEAFLNMIYSHLDLKNRSKQDLSTQDLRFLQKIKSLIVSNSNLGKNLRNPNFTDENTIFLQPCFLITSSKTSVPVTLLSKYSSGLCTLSPTAFKPAK